MTVVLALKCADGLVMAADSQITEGDRGMSYPARKLHPMGDHAAWGGSGARSVLNDLELDFEESAATILESSDVGRAIQERVLPVLRHHYDHFIAEVPGESTSATPSAYVLAAGYAGERPFIVEINPNAMVGHYEDIGFHAVGSGAPMAHQAGSLLAHFQMKERSTHYGLVVVLRVLNALSLTSPSVGGPLSLCRITPDGAHHLDSDEVEELGGHLERWNDLEQEALDRLFDGE